MSKFLPLCITLVLTSLCLADDPQPRAYAPEPSYGPANYQFAWNVLDTYSSNNYGQDEKRDGARTSGSYYVALPDGRLQKVSYTVDGDNGYQADVTYEGEARAISYPQPAASSYAPVRVPAPKSYTPVVVTEAPYQQAAPVIVNNPAPITYSEPAPAPAPAPVVQNYQPVQNVQSFEPAPVETFEQEPFAQASSVDESNAQPGEVYYKPLENAPEPEVYYKPLPEAQDQAPAQPSEVYYKPINSK